MTRGDISVTGVDPQHLQLVLHKLHDAGATVTQTDDGYTESAYYLDVALRLFPAFEVRNGTMLPTAPTASTL